MPIASRGLIASLVISLLAAACGGGGGGGGGGSQDSEPEPPPITPPDPEPPSQTFSLSGTITASASQAVDSDTNDPNPARLAISNNTPALAQSLSNPTTLGGYINRPGTGAPGRSRESGDLDDYFLIDLLAGQMVTLLVGNFEQADADLYLYAIEDTINPVDFSIDTGELESLLIAEDGTYLVRATAWRGATNYNLIIGTPNATQNNLRARYTLLPGEAVVTYKEDEQQTASAVQSEEITRELGMKQRAGGRGRGRLMALRQGLGGAQLMEQRLLNAAESFGAISNPDVRARWETLMTIKFLREDPRFRYAEPNYQVKSLATPDDEAYPLQWHYPLIGLPEAWETTTGDSSVVVAVIDTGVLADHPDLAGQLVDGYDFVSDPVSAGDGDGIDPNPEDPGSGFGAGSESFHGTHVSGTVAARGNNEIGVAGVAYGVRVMPVRALGAGGAGSTFDVDQAVRFAAGLMPDGSGPVPQQPADIINLSLGGAPFSPITQNLYNEVRAAGIAVVAAAGNSASSVLEYPASYDGVISVSAVDIQRRLATYSNTGSAIDVAAPGGDNSVDINGDGYSDGVLSTGGTIESGGVSYEYSFLNGTSMAAPHVAGVLALMKSVNPDLTPADIDALLSDGQLSDDLGPVGRDDQFGHGIINAQRAVLAALEATGTTPADNPRLTASASALNFGSSTTTLELVLRNDGKGELALLSLSTSEPWLQVEAESVDADGLGTYLVKVDRSDLPAGIYTADINIQSDVNNLVVRAQVSVGDPNAGSDVGVIYILLYDPLLDEVVASIDSAGGSGGYAFEFDGIAAGEYELVAGSDADNDLFICDAGEACGAWLTIDQPILIQLDSNQPDLNFPVEFLVSLPTISGSSSQPVTTADKQRIASDQPDSIAKENLGKK